ncbi:MAG: hypothetical protein JWP82_2041 [Humibacillus sp.]|nr:hypothetical protein [Humibacillus sp.]
MWPTARATHHQRGSTVKKRPALIVAVLVVVAVFAAAWTVTRHLAGPPEASSLDAATTAQVTGARVSLPGNVPASGEPELPSLSRLHPRPGAAVQAEGPFDDRFTLTGLRFDGRAVTASALITSDVSDVLELGALAGFYDERGVLIGTAPFGYHNDESAPADPHAGPPNELEEIRITVPKALQGTARSVAVGVTVLVNE